jgi:hypothetical protein
MRDRYNTDHRNPRLIKSHWDENDEFVNVRTNPSSFGAGPSSVSTTQCVFALMALVALFTAVATIIKIYVGNATQTGTSLAKCNDQKQTRQADVTTRSQTMQSQRSMLTTTREVLAAEKESKEPVLVKETRESEVVHSTTIVTDGPACDTSLTTVTVVQSEKVHIASALTTRTNSSSLTVQEVTREAVELAEKIKITTSVFQEQGLDAHRAQDFVLQRHLSDLQEQSRRDYENERLAIECKLRSVELEMAERRHRESIATHRMDPNWINKCLAARDSVLGFTLSSTLYLICAVMLDQLCKSGIDTVRSELVRFNDTSGDSRLFSVINFLISPVRLKALRLPESNILE